MSASFTVQELSRALGVTAPVAAGEPCRIATDTRKLARGDLFVALRGEHFDGHHHLEQARDAGAAGAVVRNDTPAISGLPLWRVEDPLTALGDLAAFHRRRFQGPVIAITGQNGKTSTKEMVAAVMATRWRTHCTPANQNNLVGVPLTLLEAPVDTAALVVEAGANLPGEIARFREILHPDIAIVTNAGAGHLAGFGSVAGVIREKLSLTLDVPLALVGTTPAILAVGAAGRALRVLTAGLSEADLAPDSVQLQPDGRPLLQIDGRSLLLAARGLHQAANAMFAWGIVQHYQLDPELAAQALEHFQLPGGRVELTEHGSLTILNDSYNANPESFRSVIKLASSLRRGRRLIFVAGTMRELGGHAERLHRQVAEELAALQPDLLALTGEFVPGFEPFREDYHGAVLTAPDAETLGPLLAASLQGDELVVLKGSRGVTLEQVIPFILNRKGN